MQRNRRRRSITKGSAFTLVELVMVIAVLAVLAVVAIPQPVDLPLMRIDMAARKVQSDIRYAQSLAVGIQRRTRADFRSAEDDYSVYIEHSPGNWDKASDPLTKEDFTVQLNSGNFTGVQIAQAYFSGYTALAFDKWGNPYGYDISTGNSLPLDNPASVRFTTGAENVDVRVERGTGRVDIQ